MKNYIRIFQLYAGGKFENNKDLKNGFVLFCFLFLITWGFTAYNGAMSYGFYLNRAGTMPGGWVLALFITSLIAVIIVYAGAFVLDYIQDWLAGEDMSGRSGGLFTSMLLLYVGLQLWDISVNQLGKNEISVITTQEVIDDNSNQVLSQYNTEIGAIKNELVAVYSSYYWCHKHNKRHDTHNPKLTSNSNLTSLEVPADVCGKEEFWFGCGNKGVNCSKHGKNKQKIFSIESRIEETNALKTTAVGMAQSAFKTDQNRFTSQVGEKKTTHTYMIYVSYVVIFICLVFNGLYINKALAYVKKHFSKKKRKSRKRQYREEEQVAYGSAGENEQGEVITDPNNNKPPDNTGKKYKKKKKTKKPSTRKTTPKKSAEDIIQVLADWKQSNPSGSKAKAERDLKGYVGRTSIYKYWDNA